MANDYLIKSGRRSNCYSGHSITRDSSGRIYVSYYLDSPSTDDGTAYLAYSDDNGSSWTEITIDSGSDTGAFSEVETAIAVDSSDVIHIIYSYRTSDYDTEVRYKTYDGSTLSSSTNLLSGSESISCDIVVDSNDYIWALVLLRDDRLKPVTAGLATLQGNFITSYTILVAGAILATLPTIIVFVFLQKYFIRGLTMGSGK